MANLQIGPECVQVQEHLGQKSIRASTAQQHNKKYKNAKIQQCVCVYRKTLGKSVQVEDFGRQSRIAQVAEQM